MKNKLSQKDARGKVRMCSSCKRGEIYDTPAEYYVTGWLEDAPFRGYLCEDHLEMYLSDGWKLTYVPLIQTETWYHQMDLLTSKYTGWDSFKQMCLSNPTLRTDTGSKEFRADMRKLRQAYLIETGKPASK